MKVSVNIEVDKKECWVLERRYYGVSHITIRQYYFDTEYEAKQEKKRQLARKHSPYSLRFYIKKIA